jgi:drug/metabolite transporter (DMT)-like permease
VLNLIGTAVTLAVFVLLSEGPAACVQWITQPTPMQLIVFALYGTIQMAIPYWLFARGLRSISPQEAGIITLIEPLLNPVWAYLITPEKDTPTLPMLIGGGFILTALAWRYVAPAPRPRVTPRTHSEL